MKGFFRQIIKKILLLFVAAFETFFMLFFMGSMFVSSSFYYVIRIVTWPFRFMKNMYLKLTGKPKKSIYKNQKDV
ncbi:hypothetical protein NH26_21960 [Flammeovirga pacifica]|uniref:Uncharacterized protein n=1 Tax=Flammeovirga pacifica TaxID=915059 RepID=A0A1S1YTB8_FLAPC|nr:hypothetical protein NH26_21960 [Flammeovirga pacifica]